MKLTVQDRPLDSIQPYDANPRHNDSAVDAVAKSITEFGFRQPIVIDEAGTIIVGHTRWKAAKQLGLAKVPVHVAKGLTEAQAKAYRLADNATGAIATWNSDLLPIELKELEAVDFDMSLLGFSDTELSRLMDSGPNPGLTDPDNIPEPPDDPITKRGDIWILGKHRLMCGDSSNDSDVDRLVAGAMIDLTNTDPPYNCKVHSRSNAGLSAPGAGGFPSPSQDKARKAGKLKLPKKMRAKDRPMTNDHVSDEQFFDLLVRWFKNFSRVMRPGRSFYIWGGFSNWRNYCQALDEVGDLHFAQGITWFKHWPVLSRTDFMNDTENAWYGWKEGAPHRFFGESNVSNCWEVKRLHPPSMIHLTEKPVELATRAMQYSSLAGENVIDLFGGSGSTLIAAEQNDRTAFLMEIDPAYCDVIVQRYEEFSGKKAELVK